MLPKDFPPRSTVQRYGWHRHSRSVKTTGSGGPPGFDADKQPKGRQRRIVTDTGGLLAAARGFTSPTSRITTAPSGVLTSIRHRHAFPLLRPVFADGPYAAPLEAACDGDFSQSEFSRLLRGSVRGNFRKHLPTTEPLPRFPLDRHRRRYPQSCWRLRPAYSKDRPIQPCCPR